MMARVDQQAKRIRELLAENTALRDRVESLESILTADVPAAAVADLTKTESQLLGLLKKRPMVTKPQVMEVLYGARIEKDCPEEKIVDVFVCKMRKKLNPLGIEIETVWGQGYQLNAAGRQALKMLEAAA